MNSYEDQPERFGGEDVNQVNAVLAEFGAVDCIGCPVVTAVASRITYRRNNIDLLRQDIQDQISFASEACLINQIKEQINTCPGFDSPANHNPCETDTPTQSLASKFLTRLGQIALFPPHLQAARNSTNI